MNTPLPMPPYFWQEANWVSFVDRVLSGRLPHALLINGDKSTIEFAKAMSHFLFCTSPIETVACGKCKDCELYLAGSHPDYFVAAPEEGSKQIKVDQIRDINAFIGKTAQRERRKVVLITPVTAMNLNAANALLKCLEEPPGDAVFLLINYKQERILPTIRSRCSRMDINQPNREQSKEWLTSKGVEEADEALNVSSGSPLLAWEWLQDGSYEKREQFLRSLNDHIVRKTPPLQMVISWKGIGIEDVLTMTLFWLESLIRRAMGEEGVPRLFALRDTIIKKRGAVLSGANFNEALLFEELAIELFSLPTQKFSRALIV